MRSITVTALLLALLPSSLLALGDTTPAINQVFPTGAFAPADVVTNSARWDAAADKKVLNVKTHFGAAGNGTTDDSDAFIAMFNFLYDRLKAADGLDGNQNGSNCEEPAAQWICYVPNGTYRVSKTLTHTRTLWTFYRGVRLIGQSRSGTIIRLDNNVAAFDGTAGLKPVIAFDHVTQDFNNWQGHNMLKNLTVDVGEGNPGAVGVDFFSANTGRIDNVTIKSAGGANNYKGAIGLHCRIGIVHGYFTNLTIDGFDVGIKLVPYHMCNPTFEHVTLRNQKTAAIQAVDGGGSFRDVYSTQGRSDAGADATGLLLANDAGGPQGGAHVILVDSSFVSTRAGGSSQAAITIAGANDTDVNSGHLFARGIDVSGYTVGLKRGGVNKVSGDIGQYATSGPSTNASMALPVENVPFIASETNTANWKSPDDFFGTHGGAGNGTTDDTAAAQAALDSGATVVYFPMQKYRITGVLSVPATVKRIELMATEFVGTAPAAYFDVDEASSTPLYIADINDAATHRLVRHSAARTLVLDSNRMSGVVQNGLTGQRLYVNNSNKFLKGSTLADTKAWVRFTNTEDKSQPNWIVDAGGVMWVLGYKCEGATVNFKVQNGGILEVLGGIINCANGNDAEWSNFNSDVWPNNAAMINDNSHLTVVACTNGLPDTVYAQPRRFTYLTGVKQGTGTPVLTLGSTFALRVATNPNRPDLRVIGLHNSFTNSAIPRAPVFSAGTIAKPDATSGTAYTGQSLSANATDANGGTLTFSKLSGPSWLNVAANGALSGTPADADFGLNTFTVKVTDPDGYSDTATLEIDVYVVKTFLSIAAEDGYVEESTETSNVGGATNAAGTGTGAIRAGDQGLDRQFKSVVSFDTASLPDGATITSASLQLKVAQAPTGTNPYTWGGACIVDIKSGAFGTNASLEAADFQAAVSAANVVSGGMPNAALNAWSIGNLTAGTLTHVNKTGKTQLRVAFTVDDNDNGTLDHVGWYSGESAGNEPKLVVRYH